MAHTTDDNGRKPSNIALPPSEVIDRYLAHECTVDERRTIDAWRATADAFDDVIMDLPALLARPDGRVESAPPSANNIAQRTKAILRGKRVDRLYRIPNLPPERAHTPWAHRIRPRATWTYVVTSIAGVVLLLAAGRQGGISELRTRMSSQVSTYTTLNGERAHITLPDGSLVTLNVASRIEVPANYAAGNRTIRLDGEALFTVNPQSGEPFTVIAGPSTTRVLGTRFTVRHYDTDTAALVAVEEGKVSVRSTVLTADQEISVSSTQINSIQTTTAGRFKFARGVLPIDGVPLQDAIPDLNRWFDADVHLGDPSLIGLLLGGEYAPGTAGDLAEILELTFDVRVVRKGRVLTLYPRG